VGGFSSAISAADTSRFGLPVGYLGFKKSVSTSVNDVIASLGLSFKFQETLLSEGGFFGTESEVF